MAQKTLSQIITQVSAEMNLPAPTVVISSQVEEVQKLLAFARAVNDDLLNEHDWQCLQTRYSITTVDGQSEYDFPTDIKRWINGTFYDSTNRWEMFGPQTPRRWEWLISTNMAIGPFERFRIFDDKLQLYPTPGATAYTFNYEYVSNYPVIDGTTGDPKEDYTQDSDLCRFDHRLVVYAIKLKWLNSIGEDTTSALADYRRTLQFCKGQDTPAPQISLLGRESPYRLLSNANIPDGSWS
jgi:hypothetical protein